MSGMRRVLEWGQQRRSFVRVEEGSTKGATVGTNLFDADGNLFDPESVIIEIIESTVVTDDKNARYTAIWRFIQEIPQRIKDLANMTAPGYIYHDGTNMVPHEWPLHDVRVELTESLVIPDNKQYIIWQSIEIEGSVSVEIGGELIILDDGLPEPIGPDLTYAAGNLTQIDYDGGEQKVLTYNGSDELTRVDFIRDGITFRKDLFYAAGDLDYIDEYYV